jgi:Lon protease-like protein
VTDDGVLPVFPLGTVLFPHVALPLHIFEARYRVLMFDCVRGEPEFGVVLIERGSEVGGGDARFATGTVARIDAAAELPDGRWEIRVRGTQRFDVLEWLPDDPYPRARIRRRVEADLDEEGLRQLVAAEGRVRRALALKAELSEPAAPPTVALDADPAARAWQLAAVAPLGPVDQQALLRLDDPVARLTELGRLADDEAVVLAYRLSGG